MRLRQVLRAVLCAGLAGSANAAWGNPLLLESGLEYDSNVHRTETLGGLQNGLPIRSSFLTRLGVRGVFSAPVLGGSFFARSFGGVKTFFSEEARGENVAIVSTDARFSRRLASDDQRLELGASYYDAFGFDPQFRDVEFVGRNFRYAGIAPSLVVRPASGHALSLDLALRAFQYKPERDFDWKGVEIGARYRGRLWSQKAQGAEVDRALLLRLNYAITRRSFESLAVANVCRGEDSLPACRVQSAQGRYDLLHQADASIVYAGGIMYDARYVYSQNNSNSIGFGQTRHRFESGVTAPLWRGVYMTVRATLRLNFFHSTLRLSPDVQSQTLVSIDEENRNTLSFLWSRDLGERLSVEARWAIYSNEFASDTQKFRRQTYYLGFAHRFAGESLN